MLKQISDMVKTGKTLWYEHSIAINPVMTIPDDIAQAWAAWRPPPLSAYPALCLHLPCLSPSTQTGHELLAAGQGWLRRKGVYKYNYFQHYIHVCFQGRHSDRYNKLIKIWHVWAYPVSQHVQDQHTDDIKLNKTLISIIWTPEFTLLLHA